MTDTGDGTKPSFLYRTAERPPLGHIPWLSVVVWRVLSTVSVAHCKGKTMCIRYVTKKETEKHEIGQEVLRIT